MHEQTKLIEAAEAGDVEACLSVATAWWSGTETTSKNEVLAGLYLNRYYLLRAKRIKSIGCAPAPEMAFQQLVSTHAEEENERRGDCVIPHVFCPACCLTVEDPAYCIFTGESNCGTAENLVGYALRCIENICKNCALTCAHCCAPLSFVAADFFTPTFHESQYLVVRVVFDDGQLEASNYGVFWWTEENGLIEIDDDIPDEADLCLLALERAAKLLEAGFDELAVACVRIAFNLYSGDPFLVHAASLFSGTRHSYLAEEIVHAHIARYPDDAIGHYQMAQVLTRGRLIDSGQVSPKVLELALASVREALLLRPEWREAWMLECLLLSLSSTPLTEIVKEYKAFLKRFPSYAPAHYDLALYCRQATPQIARRHFDLAKRLMPSLDQFPVPEFPGEAEAIAEAAKSAAAAKAEAAKIEAARRTAAKAEAAVRAEAKALVEAAARAEAAKVEAARIEAARIKALKARAAERAAAAEKAEEAEWQATAISVAGDFALREIKATEATEAAPFPLEIGEPESADLQVEEVAAAGAEADLPPAVQPGSPSDERAEDNAAQHEELAQRAV
ncbi:MAG: hypothetical protein K2W95_19395 [Candidatus Obscuribacterales bacterium]|nr:hypothetical protein [Candidatus Obscuribacterales bacterium]